MRFDVTLRDPLSTRPDLVLQYMAHDGGYQRGFVQRSRLSRLTQLGSAVRTGPVHGSQYLWALSVDMTEGQALALQSFVALQEYRSHLLFVDEYEYLPAAEYGGRSLLPESATTIDGEACSFCIFKVFMQVAQNPLTHQGQDESGRLWKRFTVTLAELPEVVD